MISTEVNPNTIIMNISMTNYFKTLSVIETVVTHKQTQTTMKLLELFSGTKSVGKVAEQLGYEVISLDSKNADISCDILDWEYTNYDSGYLM